MYQFLDFIYLSFLIWTGFSTYWIVKVYRSKDLQKVNPYLYDIIPSVFTTLGVLGTFLGIYIGLRGFNVDDITKSIPILLEGLKTAFLTSIIGIILSILFSKASKIVYHSVEINQPPKPTDEISALNKIITLLETGFNENNLNMQKLESALVGENENSISTQIVKLRNQNLDILTQQKEQNIILAKVREVLGGGEETSLLSQLQRLRAEQNDHANANQKNIEWIVTAMANNNKVIETKFTEFTELLAKNNTEALVDVMKKATEEFNNQMSFLINKLVQENFAELNNSVQKLNQWQMENKEMITMLTDQFKSVSNDFSISSATLKEVSTNTATLTDNNSQLVQIVDSLKKVMVDDKKFTEITSNVAGAVEILKSNIEAFDQTTQQLNQWVKKQRDFSDSVSKLLVRLEEIEKIKDINEIFWKNLKTQLNDGVSILDKSMRDLDNEVNKIHGHFYEKLNDTFQNLDNLIQRVVAQYN